MTHGEPDTYPRTADVIGFCRPEQAVDVAEKVVLVQRDFGDRSNRKHARLKYTIEDRGLAWFRAEVERRLGYPLEDPRPYPLHPHRRPLRLEPRTHDGNWHYTLFVENGRIKDTPERPMRTGLRKIAEVHKGEFRLTAEPEPDHRQACAKRDRKQIEALLQPARARQRPTSGLRLNAMACVALPTCGLALAESERYLPDLVDALEEILDEAGLRQDEIVIRMTGCPNGCARPYLAEIGLVGRGPGIYNLYLGAAFDGTRLNKLYRQDVDDDADHCRPASRCSCATPASAGGERFGDFVIRAGHVKPTLVGNQFHV